MNKYVLMTLRFEISFIFDKYGLNTMRNSFIIIVYYR